MSPMRLTPCAIVIAAGALLAACSDDPNNLKGGRGYSGVTETPAPAPEEPAPAPSTDSTSTPTGGSSGTTTPTPPPPSKPVDTSPEQICVDSINSHRLTLGLAPYKRWETAEACSSTEAKSDAASNKAHGAFGQCQEFAQNECPGWPGPSDKMIPSCLKMMWAEGPGGGHYENMRSTRYTQVSCGFAVLPNGNVWSVQNFK